MQRLIKAAMCDLYPGSDDLPGIAECDLDNYLERFRKEAAPPMYAGVVAGSVVYQLAPIYTIGKPVPAMLLSKEDRDQHALKVASTDSYALRQAVFLVKLVAGLCWGQDPKVRAKMNLEPYPADPGTFRTS